MYRSEEAGDCGVPDGHETLQERFSNRIIKKTSLDTSLPYRQVLLSASVGCDHLSSRRPYPLTVTDDNILNLSLTCESGAGAVLLIDEPGIERQAIINTLFIVRYMREYYDKWLQLAKTTGITPPGEGINFVSQTYSAQARGAVAFAGYPKNAKLEITWDLADDAFEATMNESKVEEDWTIATPDMHCRVRGKHDQVLFIQYYKMKRRLFWLRTIKASAGPHELPGPPNERGAAGVYADYAQRGEPDTLKVVENDELVDQLIDYIFENSTAEYACASTHDVMALLKATSGTRKIKSPASRDDFATLLKLSNQAIVVDDHGVGIFKHNFAEDIENDTESSSVVSTTYIFTVTTSCYASNIS
ncbi:hypothetical protein C8Q80DRAFT_958021 [Daedaleopsis nitida]|nr:hypothetical protein C8Q80DRAFT_958021 [Daedaleopsis nitida]